jgi:exoribonuclease R
MTFLCPSYDAGPFLLSDGTVLSARPPKALPGDSVSPEGILLDRGVHKHLVGVVDFRNRTSMGRSKAGVPLYLFHPINPGYPPFIVGSKDKPAENTFCTVEFVSWTDEWPRGAIQERLGPVGDAAVEKAALIASASSHLAESKKDAAAAAASLSPLPVVDLSSYKDEPWTSVIHIDPAGCEDVDDILAWRDEADGSTTWLIGIADVAAWIPEGSPLDRQAFLRAQTLYDDGVPVSPMLPHILSTGLASLRSDGVKRPVLGLPVVVSSEGAATIGSLGFYQVAVKETYTYESVEGTDVGKRVRGLSLSLALGKDTADSHEWIETVMVTYNVHVARILRSASAGGLLRRLPASEAPYAMLAASTGCAELEHLGRQAGEYCDAVDAASAVDVAHAALGLSEYCHASSPLRRYADLVNQRVLHHLLRGALKPAAVSAAYLNYRASVLRRTERELWFLACIRNDAVRIPETEGILLSDSSAYCPKWKRVLKVVVEPSATTAPDSLKGVRGLVRVFVDQARPRLHQRTVCSFVSAEAAVPDAPASDADTI